MNFNVYSYFTREQNNSSLINAARFGTLSTIQGLVQARAVDINVLDENGFAALHYASANHHWSIVNYLLQNGANINLKDSRYGSTPLYQASMQGHLDVVQLLVQRGADVNAANNTFVTPLHAACDKGHYSVAQFLIQNGAIVNNNGWTPLHFAVRGGYFNVVQLLVEQGKADIDAKTLEGQSTIELARAANNPAMVEYLQSKNINPVRDLLIASQQGDLETVKRLLSQGCGVDSTNDANWAPLHCASEFGQIAVAQYLLSLGATVDIKGSEGSTPLKLAANEGHLPIIKLLIERKADVNATNDRGNNPLQCAGGNGHVEIVRFLLQHGAELNLKDKEDDTPLHDASAQGHLRVVELLVQHGANLHLKNCYGKTPLDLARENNHHAVVTYLEGAIASLSGPTKPASLVEPEIAVTKNGIQNEPDVHIGNSHAVSSSRNAMQQLLRSDDADPVELSLDYIVACTDDFAARRRLGSGAFGEVYVGEDPVLNARFAVKKVLLSVQDEDILEQIRLSFRREISALKRFRHPNIIALYGYNLQLCQSKQFLVYEYASRGSLDRFLIDNNGRVELQASTRLSIMYQLARSVHFLHTGGCGGFAVFHRDIKSGNICLMHDFTAKLIDCGMAKFVAEKDLDAAALGSVTPSVLKSSGGVAFGTPGYIDPFYARGSTPFVAASDVYSIGVVFVELIVGCLQGGQSSTSVGSNLGDFFLRYVKDEYDDRVEDGWKLLMDEADPLAGWNATALEQLAKLALRCLEPSPRRRIATEELVSRLDEIASMDFCEENDILVESVDSSCKVRNSVIDYNGPTCVLCNRAVRGIICQCDHSTCSSCLEGLILKQMGKGRSVHCAIVGCTSAAIDDEALYGVISGDLYNLYIAQRAQQQVIDDHLKRIEAKIDHGFDKNQVMLANISARFKRSLAALALLSTKRECPSWVWLVPANVEKGTGAKAWARNLVKAKYKVCFICQHSRAPGHEPFEIQVPRAWLSRVAPVLKMGLFALRIAVNAHGLPFPVPGVDWSSQLQMMTDFIDSVLDDKAATILSESEGLFTEGKSTLDCDHVRELVGPAFDMLAEKANKPKRSQWKDEMRPVLDDKGFTLWIKNEYLDWYE